jgi:hypothetical protein
VPRQPTPPQTGTTCSVPHLTSTAQAGQRAAGCSFRHQSIKHQAWAAGSATFDSVADTTHGGCHSTLDVRQPAHNNSFAHGLVPRPPEAQLPMSPSGGAPAGQGDTWLAETEQFSYLGGCAGTVAGSNQHASSQWIPWPSAERPPAMGLLGPIKALDPRPPPSTSARPCCQWCCGWPCGQDPNSPISCSGAGIHVAGGTPARSSSPALST